MMPAGTAAPTCPNGSTNAAAPPKTTTTRTMPRRPGRAARAVPGADQPHRSRRQYLRLVLRPRRGRRLGTDRPRRHPPPGPGRLRPSPHPLVLHPPRARRHRGRARLRPRPPPLDTPAGQRRRNRDGPDQQQAAALADFLRGLNVTFTPIASGTCDHAGREDRYTPSRKLQHLVRARTARCTAPGCGAQAVHCDLDHTLAYPAGITCQCDLAPACRRHHRSSKPPAGHSPSPSPASCPGPRPPDAATPPGPPSTSNEDPACACLLAGALAASGSGPGHEPRGCRHDQ